MHYNREEFKKEIQAATADAELYNDGPSVHYGTIPDAYAVNISIFDNLKHDESGALFPTPDSEMLIVQRGSGDGALGSWSGISGYIDRPDTHDPLRHSVLGELSEEVGIDPEIANKYELLVGQRFAEQRFAINGIIHIIPVAITPEVRPDIKIDGTEVTDYLWIALGSLISSRRPPILYSDGYLQRTLPGVLQAFDLSHLDLNLKQKL